MRGGRADDPQPFRAGDRRNIGSVDRDLVECELSGDDFLDGDEGVALFHQETEVLVGVLGPDRHASLTMRDSCAAITSARSST